MGFSGSASFAEAVFEASAWEPGEGIRIEIAAPGLPNETRRGVVGVVGDREVMELTV